MYTHLVDLLNISDLRTLKCMCKAIKNASTVKDLDDLHSYIGEMLYKYKEYIDRAKEEKPI